MVQCSETCSPGKYFVRERRQCVECPRGTYQPQTGQDFCVQCPAETTTDNQAAVSALQCKSKLYTNLIRYRIAFSKGVITIAIRLRYDDTTTHSTTTEVIEITICVRFDCDTTTIRLRCIARACFHSTRFDARKK